MLGQIYKLRNPSAKFLASLPAYDSSNPTKDWGYPELSFQEQSLPLSKSKGKAESKSADGILVGNDLPQLPDQLPSFEKVNLIFNIKYACLVCVWKLFSSIMIIVISVRCL